MHPLRRFLVLFALLTTAPIDLCSAPLNFAAAWERVKTADQMQIAALLVESKRGEVMQAGLLPNPVMSVEVEKDWGAHAFNRWNESEVTFSVSQLVELGGKQDARFALSQAEMAAAEWEQELESNKLQAELVEAMLLAAIAQERMGVADAQLKAATAAYTSTQHFLTNGRATAVQGQRAMLRKRQAELQRQELLQQLEVAYLSLASLWGGCVIDFEGVSFPLYTLEPMPPLAALLPMLDKSPIYGRAATATAIAAATTGYAYAQAYPDVDINFGYRAFGEAGEQACTIGISIPLPFFNRNQGNIYSAEANLQRAQKLGDLAAREQVAALTVAYRQYEGAYQRAKSYASEFIPAAEAVFSGVEEGYQCGKLLNDELLEAQQMLFESRSAYINALHDYHRSRATLSRLTGHQLQLLP